MLDIKYIRENADFIKKAAADKRMSVDLDELLTIDAALKPLQQELEVLQAERNTLSKTIGKAPQEEREALKAKVSAIKTKMEELSSGIKEKKQKYDALMLLVPAPARKDVPVGKDDQENLLVKKHGEIPEFDFKTKDHVAIGEKLDIIDIPRGVKLAGSRSYVLKGDGALLEQAILRFTYDLLVSRGFTPLSVPVLVREEAMVGTGYFPTGRDQAYCVEKDEMSLVGTAEVSLTSYLSNEMLKEADLPIRLMAQSSCFRREAGTYGKDTHGLYRVHQFQKIEQVIICKADEDVSEKHHNELLDNAEAIVQALGLPYQVVYVCTGDLGQGQVRKHDIETWMPSRKSYGETHSCSTFHEFQARRLALRYKTKEGKKLVCHTLNNTAVASPRILIPLIEHYQQKDGSLAIPKVLQPYMGGKTKIG